jgi:hypothetical protein
MKIGTFDYVQPNENQVTSMQLLRDKFTDLESTIKANTTPSREQSLALTKLEEAAMWANKAVSRAPAV